MKTLSATVPFSLCSIDVVKRLRRIHAEPPRTRRTLKSHTDPLLNRMEEDDDTASTLKSAHLAEWIHGMGGRDHHHHDPYYVDEHGKRHYQHPHAGYEGPGHVHYGRSTPTGYYGAYLEGYSPDKAWESAYGLYKGGAGDNDTDSNSTVPSQPLRKWWTKIENYAKNVYRMTTV